MLADVTEALRRKGLVMRWAESNASDLLADEQGLQHLWALVDFLLSVNDRWNQESREALLGCAVVPGWDGGIWPIAAVFRADQATQDLFADLDFDTVFLDDHRLERVGTRLTELAARATPDLAIGWAERVLLRTRNMCRGRLPSIVELVLRVPAKPGRRRNASARTPSDFSNRSRLEAAGRPCTIRRLCRRARVGSASRYPRSSGDVVVPNQAWREDVGLPSILHRLRAGGHRPGRPDRRTSDRDYSACLRGSSLRCRTTFRCAKRFAHSQLCRARIVIGGTAGRCTSSPSFVPSSATTST